MSDELKPMRLAVGQALVEYGKSNPDLVVLDADTSSSTQTRYFAEAFPERFFNVGISESNMVSIASGLSRTGKVPFVASFAFLLAFRAGDQVRSQVAYGNLNVKLLGGYAGLSDFADGASHQSVADLAVMRSLPNMTVVCCADLTEADQVVGAALEHRGPVYIRISRAECPRLFDPRNHPFHLGKGIRLRNGEDITLIATGTMVEPALKASEELSKEGIGASVIEMHTVKPIDRECILEAARKTRAIVTCEEGTIMGGLFSAVSEVVVQSHPVPVFPIGIRDRFGETGRYPELLKSYGLNVESIVETARRGLGD